MLPYLHVLIAVFLFPVFDGRQDATLARISDFDNSAMVTILESDDPNGRFGFPIEYQDISIAEDYYTGMASSTQARMLVERRMGIYETVEVYIKCFYLSL